METQKMYILDCNEKIVGNPKGYATCKGAEREAWGRHYAEINARFDAKHKDDTNPQGAATLFSIRSFDAPPASIHLALGE